MAKMLPCSDCDPSFSCWNGRATCRKHGPRKPVKWRPRFPKGSRVQHIAYTRSAGTVVEVDAGRARVKWDEPRPKSPGNGWFYMALLHTAD